MSKKAREWWKKAQKEGEEKWLVAHLSAEHVPGGFFTPPPANKVIFRAVGAKYPARLAEFYQTVLRKQPERETMLWPTRWLRASSRVRRSSPYSPKGPLTSNWFTGLRRWCALAELDPEAFRKHLVAALKRVAPDAENRFPWTPEVDLAGLVLRTNDPACWEALADAARWCL